MPLFKEIKPGTKFKLANSSAKKKKTFIKSEKRKEIGYDNFENVLLFSNATSGEFHYDFDDFVAVDIVV